MSVLVGRDKIYNSVRSGAATKVIDPACGTGGFLVYLMQDALSKADADFAAGRITKKAFSEISTRLKQNTFYGADANDGVACAAKMNMIIAGDGHTNIQPENSLSSQSAIWNKDQADCDLIITNPPFGASEGESLSAGDWEQYEIKHVTTQTLFLQKMLSCAADGSDICTVIDDGLLNTATTKSIRQAIFQKARVKYVLRLPEETFRPNKITVRSSVLLLSKYEEDDVDIDNEYKVRFIDIPSLGYHGSGESVRGFDFDAFLDRLEAGLVSKAGLGEDSHWRSFEIPVSELKSNHFRLDLKFWEPQTLATIEKLRIASATPIAELNLIKTLRGKSPKADSYVDEKDGYALVVKAGSNISRYGELIESGDFVEKDVYDDMTTAHIQFNDVLLSSTGMGTLGKACVYNSKRPALADGHVTIIRVDPKKVNPYYLADYLRVGAGALQVERLYTGSTGLIELQPDEVDLILVDLLSGIKPQAAASKTIRSAEVAFRKLLLGAETNLASARNTFAGGA